MAPSGTHKLVAEIVTWFRSLIAIQVAASILGLKSDQRGHQRRPAVATNLVVALLIIVVAALIDSGLVRRAASSASSDLRHSAGELGQLIADEADDERRPSSDAE